MGSKIWDLLRESVLVQASIALTCLLVISYLAVTQQPIPEILSNVFMAVIGFYFGQKVQQQAFRAMGRE